jgi:hypothetical protein
MNILMNRPTLVLDRFQSLALVDGAGTVASVESGCLWITMEKDRRDIVLGPGEACVVDRDGRTLMQAQERSTIVLTDPAPRRRAIADHLRDALARIVARLPGMPHGGFVPYY